MHPYISQILDLIYAHPKIALGATAFIAFVVAGKVFLTLRLHSRSKRYHAFWENVVKQKVEDPFILDALTGAQEMLDKLEHSKSEQGKTSTRLSETAILGDLFIESSMKTAALTNLLNSYGLETINGAHDLASSPTAETIARVAAMSEKPLDGFGNAIDGNAIPNLVPTSTLYQIRDYVNNHQSLFGENIKSFAGKVGETEVANSLKDIFKGYPPESQMGFDLYVDGAWLNERIAQPVFGSTGIVQVKTVNSPSAVYRHFKEYIDNGYKIPVIAPDHVVSQLSEHEYADFLIPFSAVGAEDYHKILSQTIEHVKDISTGQFGEAIDQGLNIEHLSNHVADIDSSFSTFPKLAVVICVATSALRNYKSVLNEENTVGTALRNVFVDTAYGVPKAVVGATASAAAGVAVNGVALALGAEHGMKELTANAYDGVRESLRDGFQMSDITQNAGSLLPFALGVAAIVSAGHYARKGFDSALGTVKRKIFEFRTRKLREIHGRFMVSLESFGETVNGLDSVQTKTIENNVYGPYYRDIRRRKHWCISRLERHKSRMLLAKRARLFPAPEYFFLAYADKRLNSAFSRLQEQRGDMVREYEEAKRSYLNLKAGEFMFKYHHVALDGVELGNSRLVEKLTKDAEEFCEEQQKLKDKGILR